MFILAVLDGPVIYAYHDKIYSNRGQAERALTTMQNSKKLGARYQVCEVERLIFK
ncbi:hypothetical protein P4V39_02670 [Brevibacillus borstelensis]|uniref:hypothetical protein n=1 Tax=Brevibacillus borstelensis TaxID=45462 RepID=UPI002E207286|nr:hypothetical protein [Brevibacillus borstelensis]